MSQPYPYRDARGRLTDEAAREIAARLGRGEASKEIVAALDLPKASGWRAVRRVGHALGLKSQRETWADEAAQIERRLAAGESRRAVAEALQVPSARVKRIALAAFIPTRLPVLPLTPAEVALIEKLALAGGNSRQIAAEVGCCQTAVATRMRRITDLQSLAPPCRCGKASRHTGLCRRSPEMIADLRELLIAGKTTTQAAAALNINPNTIRPYAQTIFANLRAEGLNCACGLPRGHPSFCSELVGDRRNHALASQIDERLQGGMTRAQIARELGVADTTVSALAKPMLAARAAAGSLCGCGRPIDHSEVCPAKLAPRRRRKLIFTAAALEVPYEQRRIVLRRLRVGTGEASIAADLRISPRIVKAIAEAVERNGEALPDCRCGRPRSHRGPCRITRAAPTLAGRPKKSPLPEEALSRLRTLYHRGYSARAMHRQTGVSLPAVCRHVALWKQSARVEKACACGRSFRHPGGCVVNTPRALNARWRARITDLIMEGLTPREVSERLHIGFRAVIDHASPARQKLFETGVACACGRPIGHPGLCSETWERGLRQRGGQKQAPRVVEVITRALLAGDEVATVAGAVSVPQAAVLRVLIALSPDQRSERRRLRKPVRAASWDGLMAQVEAAVSRQVFGGVRQEFVSDLYFAVIEGRIEREQLAAAASVLVNRSWWDARRAPESLDAPIHGESGLTFGGLAQDNTALGLVEELAIGEAR